MTDLLKVDVVGVGLNATDTIIPLPHYPVLGSKVEFRSANVLLGGQVATAVIACQHWGLRTRYVGKVGEDAAAEMHRAEFAKVGVEAHLFTAARCASQQAFILIDDTGERTVLWKRDPRLTLQPEELQRAWIFNARALHVDGHDTAAASQAARWARAAGVPVIADIDDVYPGVEQLLWQHRLPHHQPRYSGTFDRRTGLDSGAARVAAPTRLPSYGRNVGTGWCARVGRLYPCLRSRVSRRTVDTTGAGDIFHAGFIYGLLQGWQLVAPTRFRAVLPQR